MPDQLSIVQPPRSAVSLRLTGTDTAGQYNAVRSSPASFITWGVAAEAPLQQVGGLNTIDEVTIYSEPYAAYGTIFVFGAVPSIRLNAGGLVVQLPMVAEYTAGTVINTCPPIRQKLPPDFTYFRAYRYVPLSGGTPVGNIVAGALGYLAHTLVFTGW